MFTGIVMARGKVRERIAAAGDLRLRFDAGGLDLAACREGDSIAVSGVCLTMLHPSAQGFGADVSAETLALTTLGSLGEGSEVNLELALRLQDRLGGHLVAGHIDGTARLLSRAADGNAQRFEFELEQPGLSRYVTRKGSVCIDGVSLTVNDVQGERFGVCLIPHTLEVTTLGALGPGDRVNVETDLFARYLERLIQTD